MRPEGRPSRQQPRCEETRFVHCNEEIVETKLQRIAEKASRTTGMFYVAKRKKKAALNIDKRHPSRGVYCLLRCEVCCRGAVCVLRDPLIFYKNNDIKQSIVNYA